MHGYATVEVGEVIKILPDINAKQASGAVVTDSIQGDELVTRVIELKHVAAAQIVPILRPLIPQQGHLAAYPKTNVLIISDRGGNIDRLETIIKQIDRANSENVEIIQLQFASASEVVRILTALRIGQGAAEANCN